MGLGVENGVGLADSSFGIGGPGGNSAEDPRLCNSGFAGDKVGVDGGLTSCIGEVGLLVGGGTDC